MGKGGGRGGKSFFSRGKSQTNSENQNTTSGGVLSNFGFGVGAGVRCDANDDSFFCQLTKFTSMISQFIFLLSILYVVYIGFKYIIRPAMRGGKRRR